MEIKALPTLAITFGLGIIVLAIMTDIISETKDTFESDMTTTGIGNESVISLSNSSQIGNCSFVYTSGSLFGYVNNTNISDEDGWWSYMSSTNFSLDSGGGILLLNGESWAGNDSLITYDCYVPSASYNMTIKGLQGQIKMANWLPTVGLVVGAVIVIGALFMFYRFKKKE